jgi:hypothetical protein
MYNTAIFGSITCSLRKFSNAGFAQFELKSSRLSAAVQIAVNSRFTYFIQAVFLTLKPSPVFSHAAKPSQSAELSGRALSQYGA